MKIKKLSSIIMAAVLTATSLFCVSAQTTDSSQKVVYSYVVATDSKIAAFDGEISYPSNYTVESVSYYGSKSVKIDNNTAEPNVVDNADQSNGTLKFNSTYKTDVYDFSDATALVTVTFNVDGEYKSSDINTTINDFYNVKSVKSGNVSFRYDEVVNGETVSSGQFNKSNPGEHVYQITYNYILDNARKTLSTVYTTEETSAKTIAEKNAPSLKSVSYVYNITEDGVTTGSNYSVNVNIAREKKLYPVYVDGELFGNYAFNSKVTIDKDEEVSFIINGNVVHVGKSFQFLVGGMTDIETDDPVDAPDTYSYIETSGSNVEKDKVEMELLATAKVENFSRMGVAFSNHPLNKTDIEADAAEVTAKGATRAGSHGSVVYNSTVSEPNVSGQYQFLFGPYFQNNETYRDYTFYFYAFVVDASGNVTVFDEPSVVSIANLLA